MPKLTLAQRLNKKANKAKLAGKMNKAMVEYEEVVYMAEKEASKGSFELAINGMMPETKALLEEAGFKVKYDDEYGDPDYKIVSWE